MSEPFAVIIPDRNDRPELLKFCFKQLSRMTVKPDMIYLIDRPPIDARTKDLLGRIKEGVELAKADGIDKVYIVENDDWYHPQYFERMAFDGDFVGCKNTIYYNIKNRTHEILTHEHSSLCFTGFRISALKDFRWPQDGTIFLDIKLWNHANRMRKNIKFVSEFVGVGIKHGIGLAGGSGHRRTFKNRDPNMDYLKSLVDQEAFQFYQSL